MWIMIIFCFHLRFLPSIGQVDNREWAGRDGSFMPKGLCLILLPCFMAVFGHRQMGFEVYLLQSSWELGCALSTDLILSGGIGV